jgi:hypothetical protein
MWERERRREKRAGLSGQSQWSYIRVPYALIMLMWHYINEER